MTAVAEAINTIWWRTLIAHRPIDGVCPICKRRKCWPWAEAFAALIAADEWHKGPPPDIDRPHKPTGVARRTA